MYFPIASLINYLRLISKHRNGLIIKYHKLYANLTFLHLITLWFFYHITNRVESYDEKKKTCEHRDKPSKLYYLSTTIKLPNNIN